MHRTPANHESRQWLPLRGLLVVGAYLSGGSWLFTLRSRMHAGVPRTPANHESRQWLPFLRGLLVVGAYLLGGSWLYACRGATGSGRLPLGW